MRLGDKRWDDAFEDLLDGVITAGHRRVAAYRAKTLLRDKTYLRGHGCHCPVTLPVHYVHSEGLREGADLVIDFGSNVGNRHRHQLPVSALAAIAPEIGGGDIVHVKADLLPAFLDHVFPRLGGPIVLVTGDSDFAPVARFRHLLDHRAIIHWFAQNCDLADRHPKLTRIPIGFDNPRYAKLDKRIGFLVAMVAGKTPFDPTLTRNDMGDQELFHRVCAADDGKRTKPARALCTFHMNQRFRPNFDGVPERLEAYRLLRGNDACHFVDRRLGQADCWRLHDHFAFEVSPRGNGLDCFRTWEALALGCIPIVKSSTLDPLFQDECLPVIIVGSFAEITPENLEQWRGRYQFGPEVTRKLTNDYWLDKIRDAAARWRQVG